MSCAIVLFPDPQQSIYSVVLVAGQHRSLPVSRTGKEGLLACDTGVILEAIRAGVGLGLGPRLYILRGSGQVHETSPVQRRVGLEPWLRKQSAMTTIMLSGAIQGGVAAHHQVQSSGRY